MIRAWRRLAMLALLLAFLRPTPALAHARLILSTPQDGSVLASPPTVIHLVFSEPVMPVGQGIIVVSPSGRQTKHAPVHVHGRELLVTLRLSESGTYVVIWQVVSNDTHPGRGRLTFSVGQITPAPDVSPASPLGLILQSGAYWLHFSGYVLGFGPLAFWLLIVRPLSLARRDRLLSRLWRLISVGVVFLLVAEPVALVAQIYSLSADGVFDWNLVADILASNFGRVLAQRLAAALLLWALLGAIRGGSTFGLLAAWAIAGALAIIDGESSHAISTHPLWLGMMADALHVFAMGLWIGGMTSLLSVWNLPELRDHRITVIAHFGNLAASFLGILALTGTAMAIMHLHRLSDLVVVPYGRALIIKSTLVALASLLALGGRRSRDERRQTWWTGEAVLLFAVLLLAGLLVSLPPPL